MRTLPLVAALVAAPAAGQLRFGPPQVVDNGIMPVDFLVFGGVGSARASTIVGREFNWLSTSNGESWTASHQGANYTSQIHRFPTQCRYCHNVSTVGGVINATSTSIKTKRSYTFTVQHADANGQHPVVNISHGAPEMVFENIPRMRYNPHETTGFRFGLGGTSSIKLPGANGFLLTAIVQLDDGVGNGVGAGRSRQQLYRNASCPPSSYCSVEYCCPSFCRVSPGNRSSVIVFKSKDAVHWQFASILANATEYPESHEGPNEHDVTLMPDGQTLMAAVRLDGGDGCAANGPNETAHYANYHSSFSTDFGETWSRLQPLPAGCARPRLLSFDSSLVLSGGRHRNANTSDVLLWFNKDGLGLVWEPHSISYHHNQGIASQQQQADGMETSGSPRPLRYDARVNKSLAPWHFGRETNAYTSIFQLDSQRFVIIYDQNTICERADEQSSDAAGMQSTKPCYTSHTYSMVVSRLVPSI